MTATLLPSDVASISDASAFRSVFAAPDETLILVLVDGRKAKEVSRVIDAAEELRKKGSKLRLLVYGDSGAILQGNAAGRSKSIGFLEPWARPLLPATLATVDAVIPLGDHSGPLLSEYRETGGRMPIVLRDVVDVQNLHSIMVPKQPPKSSGTVLRTEDPAPKAAGVAHFVLQNEWGIGDELLLSAVAREIVRSHPGTEIWIRSRFGFRFPKYVQREPAPQDVRRIETIYQNATLYGPNCHSPFPGHLVQQMLDKVALDTGLKVKALDLRPELEIEELTKREDASVILHSRPNPRLPSKDWGVGRWQELASILNRAGVRVRQVGGKEEPLLEHAQDLRGVPVHELPELFARSAAVACVVGFLMHMAEATRTPAVVIYGGREHPAIDGYPDQIHLSSQPLSCRGRWGCHLGPDLDCPHGMKCMEHITPELVAREVLSTISRGGLR